MDSQSFHPDEVRRMLRYPPSARLASNLAEFEEVLGLTRKRFTPERACEFINRARPGRIRSVRPDGILIANLRLVADEIWLDAEGPAVLVGYPPMLDLNRRSLLRRLQAAGYAVAVLSCSAGWSRVSAGPHIRVSCPGVLPPPSDAEVFGTELELTMPS